MKTIAAVTTALALLGAACSGAGDADEAAPTTTETTERATTTTAPYDEPSAIAGAEQVLGMLARREWAPLYDALDPAHQQLVSADQFFRCAPTSAFGLVADAADQVGVRVIDVVINGTVTLTGTADELPGA